MVMRHNPTEAGKATFWRVKTNQDIPASTEGVPVIAVEDLLGYALHFPRWSLGRPWGEHLDTTRLVALADPHIMRRINAYAGKTVIIYAKSPSAAPHAYMVIHALNHPDGPQKWWQSLPCDHEAQYHAKTGQAQKAQQQHERYIASMQQSQPAQQSQQPAKPKAQPAQQPKAVNKPAPLAVKPPAPKIKLKQTLNPSARLTVGLRRSAH